MKSSALRIMLFVIGATFPVSSFAAMDPAALERQRQANRAALNKSSSLKRHFDKSNENITPSIKLDAIPQSPHRHAKTTSASMDRSIQASPRHTPSAKLEQALVPQE